MKKIAIIVAFCMLMSLIPQSFVFAGDVLYSEDFSLTIDAVVSNAKYSFIQPEKFAVSGGKLTTPADQWASISTTDNISESVYTLSADLSVNTGDTTNNVVAYNIGIRVPTNQLFLNEGGLWASVKGNQLFIMMGARDKEGILVGSLPVRFEKERKIFIEDNKTEINYYADNDKKTKTLLARVNISPDSLQVFNAAGEPKGVIKDHNLSDSGIICLMPHFIVSTLDNLEIKKGVEGLKNVKPEEEAKNVWSATTTKDGKVTYTNNFNAPDGDYIKSESFFLFSQPEKYELNDGKLTTPVDQWSVIGTSKMYGIAGSYSVSADISANTEDKDNKVVAFALGVRVGDPNSLFIGGKGLWAMAKENQIFLMLAEQAQTGVLVANLPVTFTKERRIFIEDLGSEIKYYANDDSMNKTLLLRAVFKDSKIEVLDAKDKLVGTLNNDVGKFGAIRFMPHFVKSTLDNLTIEFPDPQKITYVPADPLKMKENYHDTWVATDDLGRSLPTFEQVGAPRDKKVGIFYFDMNDDKTPQGIFDHTKAYRTGGVTALWEEMKKGPQGYNGHYWAEPYFGYYRADDEWVIRKHAAQLTNAGVDFIFLDISNEEMYISMYTKIFETYRKIRDEGGKTPQIAFFSGFIPDFGEKDARVLWSTIYESKLYSDLWFMWEGKPLVLANFDMVDPTIKNFFTVRESWAYTDWAKDGMGKWSWICETPQVPGKNPKTGEIEQMSVAAGFHANSHKGFCRGRSFANNTQPTDGKKEFEFALTTTPYGLAFEEQWNEALKVDPQLIMITGWNEWNAGRWEDMADGQLIANTYVCDKDDPDYKNYYVDAFNTEYSRDVEPVKGEFGDNYYYQMVSNIRKFKGVRPIPAAGGQKTIDINGGFEQWASVYPEYRDTVNDTYHRNHVAFGDSSIIYKNDTGRNDIDISKVSIDNDFAYFYVSTKDAMTQPSGDNWMNLFIDSDNNSKTGWKGYDLLINRTRNGNKCSVEKASDGWNWSSVGEAEITFKGNEMMIKIPKNIANLNSTFDFKWADNSSKGDVMEFLDKGDAAPDDRYNFRYTTKAQDISFDSNTLQVMNNSVALAVNRYQALIGSKQVMIDSNNTKVTPFVKDGRTLVPVRFIAEAINGTVDYNNDSKTVTINSNGKIVKLVIGANQISVDGVTSTIDAPAQIFDSRTFLPLRALVEAVGKKVTWDKRGLIIIGDQEISDSLIIDEIYRSL